MLLFRLHSILSKISLYIKRRIYIIHIYHIQVPTRFLYPQGVVCVKWMTKSRITTLSVLWISSSFHIIKWKQLAGHLCRADLQKIFFLPPFLCETNCVNDPQSLLFFVNCSYFAVSCEKGSLFWKDTMHGSDIRKTQSKLCVKCNRQRREIKL